MADSRENTGNVGKGKPPKHTQFQPGQSGNPKGRPEGSKNRSTIIKKWLDVSTKIKTDDGQELEGTVEDEIVLSLIKAAKKGDVNAVKEVLDSVYGKNTDKVQHSADPDAPVIFQIDGRFKDATENS